jgi:hypothetical protein
MIGKSVLRSYVRVQLELTYHSLKILEVLRSSHMLRVA